MTDKEDACIPAIGTSCGHLFRLAEYYYDKVQHIFYTLIQEGDNYYWNTLEASAGAKEYAVKAYTLTWPPTFPGAIVGFDVFMATMDSVLTFEELSK